MNSVKMLFSIGCLSVMLATSVGAPPTFTIGTVPDDLDTVLEQRIVKEAYRRIGIEAVIRHYPSGRSVVEANEGNTDAELIRNESVDKDFLNLIRVPESIVVTEEHVFVKSPDIEADGYEDLKPYTIGILKGIASTEKSTRGLKRFMVKTPEQLFKMLDLGRVDAVVSLDYLGLNVIKRLNLEGVRMLTPAFHSFDIYHFVHKKHESLVPKLTIALREMKRQGVTPMPLRNSSVFLNMLIIKHLELVQI
jgi:polar amino acid transport system substrate-binding protein